MFVLMHERNPQRWQILFSWQIQSVYIIHRIKPLYIVINHGEPSEAGKYNESVDWQLNTLGLMSRVFAYGPGDLGSIPGHVIPKTLKTVLDTSLLSTHQYKVRIRLIGTNG